MKKIISLLSVSIFLTVCFAFAGSRIMKRDVDPGDGAVTLTEVTSGRDPVDILAAHRYVSRGDLGSWDFIKSDFTIDQSWNDLQITNEIPTNASIVLVRIQASVTALEMEFILRKKGVTGGVNNHTFSPPRTNYSVFQELFVGVDTNSILQYKFLTNGTWSTFKFSVLGYFKGE